MSAEPTFLADEMLGKLARWLRLFGFDVAYEQDRGDAALIAQAQAQGRILLTRDKQLALSARARDAPVLLLHEVDPDAQLEEVVRGLRLRVDPERVLSRCSECNTRLGPATPTEVQGKVPEGVHLRHGAFQVCPACGKAYWEGSHTQRIRARARTLSLS